MMLQLGPAKKVTIYVGEAVKHRHEPVFIAVLNYLFYHDVANATVTRGAGGFGADHRMQMARFVETSLNLPVKIEFIEERAKTEEILPKLLEIVEEGLVEIHDTTIVKVGGSDAAVPVAPAVLKGKATLMRVYVGEQDKWRGKPLYDAIVESLRAHDIAGATVYRGIGGYGANGRFRKAKPMSLSSDLPIVLSVVDEEAKIRAYLPVLEQMIDDGLVVLSDADVIKYTHRLNAPLSEERQP
jgi:PII-like signaling protein